MFSSEKLKALFGLTQKISYKQVPPHERNPLDTDPFEDQIPDSGFNGDSNSDPDSNFDLAARHGFSGGESSDSADSAKHRAAIKGPNQTTMQDKEEVDYGDDNNNTDDDAVAVRVAINSRTHSKSPQECCLCNTWMCSHGALERNE